MEDNPKLKKLKDLMKMMDESLTREEFVKSFKAVVDYVKKGHEKIKQDHEALTQTLTDKVEAKLKGLDGKDGYSPKKGIDFFDGEKGDDGKDGESVVGPPGKDGLNGSPDKPEDIRNKLHSLKGDDRLDVKYIKGFDDLEKRVAKGFSSIPRGGTIAVHPMLFKDLSAQTNGTLKVFAVPKSVRAVVFTSDFPYVLIEGNGFTLNAARTTLTLTAVNAPSTGAQLLFQYSSLFNQTT